MRRIVGNLIYNIAKTFYLNSTIDLLQLAQTNLTFFYHYDKIKVSEAESLLHWAFRGRYEKILFNGRVLYYV